MKQNCFICTENDSKYKCPTCEAPYCSVPCFQKHKETPCQKPDPDPSVQEDRKQGSTLLFTTIDTVSLEDLEKLKQTEAVKNLLYNPHLRKLLSEIDTSYNPGRAIQAAMMEPLFLEFANECLKVIDPGSDAEEDVLGI